MYPREEILLKAILIASVVIGTIILYFLLIQVKHRRLFRRLSAGKLADEIGTLENERKRLSADVHDDLGPILSLAKLKLGSVDSCSEADRERIHQSIHLIEDLVYRVRRIASDLLPPTLARQGLAAALTEFIDMVRPSAAVRISFTCMPGLAAGNPDAIHLFRIVQEIIHNTIKHARARHLRIVITESRGMLQILTADDGAGFINKGNQPSGGRGLHNIQNRVAMLNGELTINTSPSKGTRYNIVVPMNR